MTYKQIETAREARLWLAQVVVPLVAAGGAIIASGKLEGNTIDEKLKNLFKKGEKKETIKYADYHEV